MPKVPVYDNFQVAPAVERDSISAGQPVTLSSDLASIPGRQMMNEGASMLRSAEAMATIAIDMQKDINEARVKERDVALATKHEDILVRYGNMQGKNAVDGYEAIKKELSDAQKDLSQGLDNDMQKRMWSDVSNKRTLAATSNIDAHWMTQTRKYQDDTSVSRIERGVADMGSNWALWQQENGLYQRAKATTLQEIELRGARNGWDSDTVDQEKRKAMTQAHSNVVGTMLSSKLIKEAKDYMTANADEIDVKTLNALQDKVKVFDIAQAGMDTAKYVWGEMGPKGINDPVKLADMEKEIARIFASEPDKAKAARDEVRAMTDAHNKQQAEENASNVNSVMDMLAKGKSITQIKTTDAWMSLPGEKRVTIQEHVNNLAIQNETRSFQRMQREDYMRDRKTAGAYYAYNDPSVLENMSRAQVQALLPVLGEKHVGMLLNQWDGMQTKQGKLTASMDKTTFDALADQYGLHPYKDKKTEAEKQDLGYVHARVNEAIQAVQAESRMPLQPDQKEAIMRDVMARTVKEKTGWWIFGSERDVPAVQAKPDDRIVVPDQDRQLIIEALKARYKEEPTNPDYAPNEVNIKKWYLKNRIKGR